MKENYCMGCKSDHMSLGNTWNSIYKPSLFNPFLVSNNIPYGIRGTGACVPSGYHMPTKENFYASSSTSWTTYGNVTPANSITHGTHMTPVEKYCCSATPYNQLGNAYNMQKPYSS